MARQPEGPPPPPPVQRIRLQYTKRGRLRFTSVRDFQRALERALRRANIPMAYSAGFNPHPKISYANASATGTASEAEYVELALAQECDPEKVRVAIDAALPPGIDIVAAVVAAEGSLADRLEVSRWQVEVSVPEAELAPAVTAFLAREEVLVERLTKNGMRTFDVRTAVLACDTSDGASGVEPGGCAILHLVVRHATPAVRPDDVLNGIRLVAGLSWASPPRVTRLAQGSWDETSRTVIDPFARELTA